MLTKKNLLFTVTLTSSRHLSDTNSIMPEICLTNHLWETRSHRLVGQLLT